MFRYFTLLRCEDTLARVYAHCPTFRVYAETGY